MNGGADLPHVWTGTDLATVDGLVITLHGRYEAAVRPVRGGRRPRPADRAMVVLDDGTAVWLEPLDQPSSIRADSERRRFDGAHVRVRGRAHRRMPATGQGLIAPCLSNVRDLEPDA